MRGLLVDAECATLRSGTNALEDRAWDTWHSATYNRETSILWLFSALAIADLSNFSRSSQAPRGMLQDSHCIINRLVADQIQHNRYFSGRNTGVFQISPCFHAIHSFRPLFRCFRAGVASEGSGGGELAQLVADHIFSNIHRDVLAAVVDRKGVTDEIREDGRASAPGLTIFFSPVLFIS